MKIHRRAILAAGTLLATVAAGLGTANDTLAVELPWPLPAARIPSTRAGKQLAWCLKHINTRAVDLSVADLEAHFSADFLAALPAAQLLSIFSSYFVPNAPMTVARLEGPVSDDFVQAILTTPGADWRVTLGVVAGKTPLIDSLFFTPVALPVPIQPALTSWSTIKTELKKVAPELSFQVSELVDGVLQPIYEIEPANVLAIGSCFKLYVLAELAHQIEAREASWEELLPIRDDLRSLPNGDMRLEATGATFPIRSFVDQMIAASDNTATDHLIDRIGRERVEAAFAAFGNSAPERNVPLLMTREWFAIKLRLTKQEIRAFLKLTEDEKREMLAGRIQDEAATLTEEEEWPGSYFIDSIEWFASASDLSRVMARLHELSRSASLRPIGTALSWNAGIAFDARVWSYVGFKGGYETGVKSDVWVLERGDGRVFVVAAIINDPKKEINGIRLSQLIMPVTELLAGRGA